MTDENFDSGFIRARRNLILMSTLILIYGSNAIGFNENSSFNGVPVQVRDIETVELWLLIFNLYFIWRYCANTDIEQAFYKYNFEFETSIRDLLSEKVDDIQKKMLEVFKSEDSKVTRLEGVNKKEEYFSPFVTKCRFDVIQLPKPPKRPDYNEVIGSNFVSPISLFWINITGLIKVHFFKLTFTEKILPLILGVISAGICFLKVIPNTIILWYF